MESTMMGGSILILIVIGLIALLSLAITVYALIDILKSEFKGTNDKVIWILITLFLNPLGGLLYLIIGRRQKKIEGLV